VLGYRFVSAGTMHAVAAAGISSEGVKDEFKAHAREEAEHVKVVAERINQLGGAQC
jgi:bacterioferritin